MATRFGDQSRFCPISGAILDCSRSARNQRRGARKPFDGSHHAVDRKLVGCDCLHAFGLLSSANALLAAEVVSLAVVKGETKHVQFAVLIHLELNESARPWSLTFGGCCEGTIRHKPCCKDFAIPGL